MPLNTQLTFNDLINSTLDKVIKSTVTDNIFKSNALLDKLKAKGRIIQETGGLAFAEILLYNPNDTIQFQSITGIINTNPQQHTERAFYTCKNISGSIVFTVKEELENRGNPRLFDILETKTNAAMSTFVDQIGTSLYGDGTEMNGQSFGGLQLLIADDPTIGTVGGIDRATNAWWRNQVKSIGASPTSAQLVTGMTQLMTQCQVQSGKTPDLIITDSNYYNLYQEYLQDKYQNTQTVIGDTGYTQLKFQGANLVLDPKCPTNRMYFINTNHLAFRHQGSSLIVKEASQRPINQLAYVTLMYSYGNLTMDSSRVHGVLKP